MHNLDRTLSTHEQEYAFESDEVGLDPEILGETYGETDGEMYGELYGELSEEEEIDLANELLAVESEEELDYFFGKLFKKVGKGLGQIARPLGKVLKPLAKIALPIAGKAAGAFFGGPIGATIGGKLGTFASNLFEVNYESMEPGEAEVDAARRFVRLANAAVQQANQALATTTNPVAAAKRAVTTAARVHAPGLLKGALPGGVPFVNGPSSAASATGSRPRSSMMPAAPRACTCAGGRPQAGRWVRRGPQLFVLGV